MRGLSMAFMMFGRPCRPAGRSAVRARSTKSQAEKTTVTTV